MIQYRHATTISRQPHPSRYTVLHHRKHQDVTCFFCNFSWKSGVSHCAPGPESPLSMNQFACVSAALSYSRTLCQVWARKFHPSTTAQVDQRHHPQARHLLPLTSHAPLIQLMTTLLSPNISRRRCSSGHQATVQGYEVFFTLHRGIETRTRRLRWFQIQHHAP